MEQSLTVEQRVAQHYAQPDLAGTILAALAAEGKNPDRLTTDDLAAVDEFHTGGRDATVAFAAELGLEPDMRVLGFSVCRSRSSLTAVSSRTRNSPSVSPGLLVIFRSAIRNSCNDWLR
jgi:hypothetical protein